MEAINWEEAEKRWKEREQKYWEDYYHEKGFRDWVQFRQAYIKVLGLKKRSWEIEYIKDPQTFLAQAYPIAPAWKRAYEGEGKCTFEEIARAGKISTHARIIDILVTFPKNTEVIGFKTPDHKILLVEGHHRAAAAALGKIQNTSIDTNLCAVLSKITEDEEEFLKYIWNTQFAFKKKVLDGIAVVGNKLFTHL